VVESWTLWIPVIATGIGALIGFGSNLATTIVGARMQAQRDRRTARTRDLDAALLALEGIGRQVSKDLISPPWWPSADLLEPARQMAYRVARIIGEDEALNEWLEAWQEAVRLNAPWRSWLWHTARLGARHRQEVTERLTRSELALAGQLEGQRPNRRP
jgi:hypothetical protein